MIRSRENGREACLLALRSKNARLCFLGIGGISMYALALLCLEEGVFVFGQDLCESERTEKLRSKGVRVYVPHAGAAVESATAVICSLAVDENAEELRLAKAAGIPIFTRGELLGALLSEYATSVAVSGSHGKSTVTAALSSVMRAAGMAPTVLAGALLPGGQDSYRIGEKAFILCEACEYGDSFLSLRPSLSLFLNLEWDHPDYFPSEEALVRSFARAVEQSGTVIYMKDSPLLCRAVNLFGAKNIISVGKTLDADYRYEIIGYENARPRIRFYKDRESIELSLSVAGRFQAENAAAVLAAASYLGIPLSLAGAAMSSFSGISRRLSRLGTLHGAPVFYDYAHHPTEIRAGIETVRELCGGEITVLFRPHTFSRTEALFDAFSKALSLAEHVYITDIDGVREQGGGVSAELLAEAAGGKYLPLSGEAQSLCERLSGPLILMGAGDLSKPLAILNDQIKKVDK